jgi:hypothetical protein
LAEPITIVFKGKGSYGTKVHIFSTFPAYSRSVDSPNGTVTSLLNNFSEWESQGGTLLELLYFMGVAFGVPPKKV